MVIWYRYLLAGIVTNLGISEASGLAASRINPGLYYTHNDSGDIGRVFALTEQGFTIGKYSRNMH